MNWIFLGALGGALAIVAGAFGAHALAARLEPHDLQLWETAARYLMYGSFALVLVGLAAPAGLRRRRSTAPAGACSLGSARLQRHRLRPRPRRPALARRGHADRRHS